MSPLLLVTFILLQFDQQVIIRMSFMNRALMTGWVRPLKIEIIALIVINPNIRKSQSWFSS